MKSVGEGYEFVLLRIAIGIMIAARRLDGAFQRLRTAIGEEHRVGKGVIHQPLRQLLALGAAIQVRHMRSEEHTSELQSLMRISYAVFCLKKKKIKKNKKSKQKTKNKQININTQNINKKPMINN